MSAAPRSQNPHLLPQEVKTVSRAELFLRDDGEEITPVVDEESVLFLNELLAGSLDYQRPKKRRKLEDLKYEYVIQEPQLFRLVAGPPILISTAPAPPPPSISKEPDPEDSPESAKLREEKARQSAVDLDWVLHESKLVSRVAHKESSHRVLRVPSPSNPPIMVISAFQPPRQTRPALPPHLRPQEYPYKADGPIPKESTLKAKCCLAVNAESQEQRKTRSRRRRKHAERPPPAFWRPNPALKGKCQGYAYGYPSSFAGMEDWDSRGITYQRDKMRRIEACNAHPRALF